jgi:hypothetical protein
VSQASSIIGIELQFFRMSQYNIMLYTSSIIY